MSQRQVLETCERQNSMPQSSLVTVFLVDTVTAVTVVSKLALLRGRTLASLGLLALAILRSAGRTDGGSWSLVAGLDDLATFELESVWTDDAVDLPGPVWRG